MSRTAGPDASAIDRNLVGTSKRYPVVRSATLAGTFLQAVGPALDSTHSMALANELQQIASRHGTDKAGIVHYLENYEQQFAALRDQDIRLLELGVYEGGSLKMWRDYFPRGLIVGLDMHNVPVDDPTGRIRGYRGLQEDTELLDRIRRETAPDGFDIIIDDCAHIGVLARISFWHLFDNHLKPGGLYVIEDWGTGSLGWVGGRRRLPARYAWLSPHPSSAQPKNRAVAEECLRPASAPPGEGSLPCKGAADRASVSQS